jgi:predicted DNA binding CopG/RHH family protein
MSEEKRLPKELPNFANEEEEANWWYDNRDLVEAEFLHAEGEGTLRRGTAMRQTQEAAARKHALTVRLSDGDLAKIRSLAAERGQNEEVCAAVLLHDALDSAA